MANNLLSIKLGDCIAGDCPTIANEDIIDPIVTTADADGMIDDNDRCPNKACTTELRDCPDTDGIVDIDDRCPDVAGVAAKQGCPAKAVASDFTPPQMIRIAGGEIYPYVFLLKNQALLVVKSAPKPEKGLPPLAEANLSKEKFMGWTSPLKTHAKGNSTPNKAGSKTPGSKTNK